MSYVHAGRNRAMPEVDGSPPIDQRRLHIPPPHQAEAQASASHIQATLDQTISEALGEHAVAFLLSSNTPDNTSCTRMSAVLSKAAQMLKDPAQRQDALHLRELYETALDFAGRLAKPRTVCGGDSSSPPNEVTLPEGESVSLIKTALESVTKVFHEQAHILSAVRETVELASVVVPAPPPPAPRTAQVERPETTPQTRPQSDEARASKDRKHYVRTLTLGGRLLGGVVSQALGALSIATAHLREILPSSKSIDRPTPHAGILKRLFNSIVEFDIQGLETLASSALGMLGPRGMAERFAQTGADSDVSQTAEEQSARRRALFKFIIDLSKMRSYFRSNPQIEDGAHWFYCKEPQVLLDHEGKMARLDSFLLQSKEGRELYDAIYQPLSVTSTTEDTQGPIITLPILPLTPTTLPLPPHHFVTELEYLDAAGERIPQPGENHLRACVAGGALVTAPEEARMVRYSHESIHTARSSQASPPNLPRPLTPADFRLFREILPSTTFNLGEEMDIVYELIREFSDPQERVRLAAHAEAWRGWGYTMDPLITAFQRAAGDAFLESVYHSRAGICDSMSAVTSFLVGGAIGLPALVVSGPVADGEFFDRKVGHSIAQAMLPGGVLCVDLTVAARSNSRISGKRVPVEAREALAAALSQSTITRREIATVYQDLGDLIRGDQSTRFNPHASGTIAPVRLWRDLIFDGASEAAREHDENFPAAPNSDTIRGLMWAAKAVQFDRLLARCERSGDYKEFCWFLAHKLRNLSFDAPKDPHIIPERWGTTERISHLVIRDIPHEASECFLSLAEQGRFSADEILRFPEIAEALPSPYIKRLLDCLRDFNYPERIAAQILNQSITRCFQHVRYLVKGGGEIATGIELARSVTSMVEYYSSRGFPCPPHEAVDAMFQVFHSAKNSEHRTAADADELRSLTLALIESLRVLWVAAGSEGPTGLCDCFISEGPALQGLHILAAREPELVRQALRLNVPDGRRNLTSCAIHSLLDEERTVLAALSLLRNAKQIMGELDLSTEGREVLTTTKRIISTFLKNRSLINWPDESHPASLLTFISDPNKGGAPAISLLKALIECGGVTPDQAKSLWPVSKEKQVAERFVNGCDFEDGGILKTSDDYRWNLSELPNLLLAIISESGDPQIAQTGREIIGWTRARGELHPLPEERHFLGMTKLLGGIPIEWEFDRHEPTLVEALAEVARGSMAPGTLYAAFNTIAPYIIPPAQEQEAEKHRAWLTNLARTMRECDNDTTATALLASAKRWTTNAPRSLNGAIEGCIAACSVADLAYHCDLNLSALTGATPFTPLTHVDPFNPDDGTSPHIQVWCSRFPLDTSYPYYKEPKCYAAALLFRDFFKRLPAKTRKTMRSQVLHFTSSEKGKLKILGPVGTPESSRPYLHGDDVRSIDWKRSGRSDTFMIKVREEREERALTIVADLGTLGRELDEIDGVLRGGRRDARPRIPSLVHAAPHLATLIHEAMVAHENTLRVDLVLTHHTVIRHYPNAAKSILAIEHGSEQFWIGVENDAEMARKLREEEEHLFGPKLFQSGSPLAYNQVDIPNKHFIHFLMGPECQEVVQRSVPLLRARGNIVSFGPLPSFRKP